MSIRAARWPDDESTLLSLDRSFESDRVYSVRRDGHSFLIEEAEVSPPYTRVEASIDLEELRASDAVLIAEHGGKVAGYAALRCEKWNRRGVLAALYVDRARRGSGVGRALVDAVEEAARASGMTRLWAETQDVNAPAVRFYRAAGFELCGVDTSLYDPGTPAGAEIALYFTRSITSGLE